MFIGKSEKDERTVKTDRSVQSYDFVRCGSYPGKCSAAMIVFAVRYALMVRCTLLAMFSRV